MQQADLIAIMEDVAPPEFAADWDKSGVQVASSRAAVGHVAVGLDPTPLFVRQALQAGADMLVTHHPLSLSPRYPDRLDAYHEILSLLFSRNVALYAAHTTLDANPDGPAVWLADELGLAGREPLEECGVRTAPDGRVTRGGFGCVGDLPAPLSLRDFSRRLRELLPRQAEASAARLVGSPPPLLRRLALCPGSGGSFLERACAMGADLLVTGDLKYHGALDLLARDDVSGAGFAALDTGHFALEEEMTRRLALLLAERLPGVSVTFVPGRDPFRPFLLSSDVREVQS